MWLTKSPDTSAASQEGVIREQAKKKAAVKDSKRGDRSHFNNRGGPFRKDCETKMAESRYRVRKIGQGDRTKVLRAHIKAALS